jgi:hypothetical protein
MRRRSAHEWRCDGVPHVSGGDSAAAEGQCSKVAPGRGRRAATLLGSACGSNAPTGAAWLLACHEAHGVAWAGSSLAVTTQEGGSLAVSAARRPARCAARWPPSCSTRGSSAANEGDAPIFRAGHRAPAGNPAAGSRRTDILLMSDSGPRSSSSSRSASITSGTGTSSALLRLRADLAANGYDVDVVYQGNPRVAPGGVAVHGVPARVPRRGGRAIERDRMRGTAGWRRSTPATSCRSSTCGRRRRWRA